MSIDAGGNTDSYCGYVPGHGPSNATLFMCGEAPARNEIRTGIPFTGAAGAFLDFICRRASLPPRDLIYITNVIKVPAIDNEDAATTEAQIREWEWMLHAELEQRKPKYVASLGAWATKWFLRNYSRGYPDTTDMEWHHGVPRQATAPWGEFVLIPCFHPAAGLHDAESIPKIYADLSNLHKVLVGDLAVRKDAIERQYDWIDSPDRFPYGVSHVAVDTESVGLHGAIKLISFSDEIGWGGVIRDPAVMHEFCTWLNHYIGTVIMHNMPHDLRILGQVGLDTYNLHCRLADTMHLAKYFNTETGSLKKEAWRLLGVEMNEYWDIVKPIQNRFAIEYLNMLNTIEYPKPPQLLEWENGQAKVKKPQGLNRRIQNILRDLAKDPATDVLKRWNDVEAHIIQPGVEVFGPMREANIEDVEPELAKNYSGQDADVALQLYWEMARRLKSLYGSSVEVTV